MILGVGIDLAEVERYRFDERRRTLFARRVYTPYEMEYAYRKRYPAERLAGFFAAKEAARKAFGFAIPWRDVGVVHLRSGKPTLTFTGRSVSLMERAGAREIHVAITHTRGNACAVVILEG
ncbi:holo-[acyl-carrier-protein] synthase [bacterium]|nr:MAG: holo-[acyl-carrier-protein] synthase [bacterium]